MLIYLDSLQIDHLIVAGWTFRGQFGQCHCLQIFGSNGQFAFLIRLLFTTTWVDLLQWYQLVLLCRKLLGIQSSRLWAIAFGEILKHCQLLRHLQVLQVWSGWYLPCLSVRQEFLVKRQLLLFRGKFDYSDVTLCCCIQFPDERWLGSWWINLTLHFFHCFNKGWICWTLILNLVFFFVLTVWRFAQFRHVEAHDLWLVVDELGRFFEDNLYGNQGDQN